MKIRLAETSGFCMGVQNAVLRIVREIRSAQEKIFIYGPLIHNPQTVEILASQGLSTIDNLDDIAGKIVAIRTHGIPLEQQKKIEREAGETINLTCPRVINVQKIIEKHSAKGLHTIITGDSEHAEVAGLKSYASSGCTVISEPSDIEKIPADKKCMVVSQTTFDKNKFESIVGILNKKFKDIKIFNTICSSTHNRQDEIIREIKNGADAVIVAGGKNSANTKRLADISMAHNIKTLHIETEGEIEEEHLKNKKNILVTAGASTPGWIINNVLDRLYCIKSRQKNFICRAGGRMFKFMARTNLLAASVGFSISLFSQKYLGMTPDYEIALLPALYAFSISNITNILDLRFLRINSPCKYEFIKKNKHVLLFFSLLAVILSTGLSLRHPFPVVYGMAAAYCLIFPLCIRELRLWNFRISIYSIKNITIAAGWVIATIIIIPGNDQRPALELAAAALPVFTIILMRGSTMDIITYQGDFIAGRKTMAVLLNHKILYRGLIIFSSLALAVYLTMSFTQEKYLLSVPGLDILYLLFILIIIRGAAFIFSSKYELYVELNFLIIILLAVLTILTS